MSWDLWSRYWRERGARGGFLSALATSSERQASRHRSSVRRRTRSAADAAHYANRRQSILRRRPTSQLRRGSRTRADNI